MGHPDTWYEAGKDPHKQKTLVWDIRRVFDEFIARTSIQCPAIGQHRNRHHDEREHDEWPHAGPRVGPSVAFEHDAADEAVEISQWQQVANKLRPVGHALKGEHEAGEQNVGQKIEKRKLHGLQLILRQRGKSDSYRQIRCYKEKSDEIDGADVSEEGNVEYEARRQQNDSGFEAARCRCRG